MLFSLLNKVIVDFSKIIPSFYPLFSICSKIILRFSHKNVGVDIFSFLCNVQKKIKKYNYGIFKHFSTEKKGI